MGEHVNARIEHWEASGTVSARTAERYRQLCDGQIIPHIGATPLQKLTTVDVELWHATLRTRGRRSGDRGISPRTILHAHRVLSHALDDAERHGVIQRNVAQKQRPPKVEEIEKTILDANGINRLVVKLEGHRLYAPTLVALFTGMRLSEILGLRWRNVDFDAKWLKSARRSRKPERTVFGFKAPKTKAGRRDIGARYRSGDVA